MEARSGEEASRKSTRGKSNASCSYLMTRSNISATIRTVPVSTSRSPQTLATRYPLHAVCSRALDGEDGESHDL